MTFALYKNRVPSLVKACPVTNHVFIETPKDLSNEVVVIDSRSFEIAHTLSLADSIVDFVGYRADSIILATAGG